MIAVLWSAIPPGSSDLQTKYWTCLPAASLHFYQQINMKIKLKFEHETFSKNESSWSSLLKHEKTEQETMKSLKSVSLPER